MPEHVEAIRRHGPCPQHRRTFAPIKTWYPLEKEEVDGEAGEAAGGTSKRKGAAGGGRKKKA